MSDAATLDVPIRLAESIDYQQGAVVSRTLVKNASGSLTLFAFDAGQELSEHTVPHQAVVQVLDGNVEIRIAGTPHALAEGQTILMPAGRPHAVRAISRFKMLLTMLRETG